MSLTNLIDDLSDNSAHLLDAMRSGDAAAIEVAVATFRLAVEQVQAAAPWAAEPGLRDKLATLMPQLDESRALSCLLADMTGQMHDLVAARALDTRGPLTARPGDRFA